MQPRDYQKQAADFLCMTKRGAVQLAAGGGKTLVAALALRQVLNMRQRQHVVKVGWMANTVEQCQQAYQAMLMMFYDVKCEAFMAKERWEWLCKGGEGRKFELKVACAAANTDWSDRHLLIIDEAHHLVSPSWLAQFQSCTQAVWGFTATPPEDPEIRAKWLALFGGKLHTIARSEVAGNLAPARVVLLDASDDVRQQIDDDIQRRIKSNGRLRWFLENENCGAVAKQVLGMFAPTSFNGNGAVQSVIGVAKRHGLEHQFRAALDRVVSGIIYSRVAFQACIDMGIVGNKRRNDAVVDMSRKHAAAQTIVLVNTVEHGKTLADRIPGSVVCHSKMGRKKRETTMAEFKTDKIKCLIATTILEEGFDASNAAVLIMVSGGRSSRAVEQRSGRVLRQFAGKKEGLIYDFVDKCHPLMAKHSLRRVEVYNKLNYKVEYEKYT